MTDTLRAEQSRQAIRVTLVGMILDSALGVAKVIVGTLFNSYALVTDGIHSFSDVASDLMVLAVAKLARQAPDKDHPYGHERFETFATVLMGSLLIAVAGAIAWDSVQRLLDSTSAAVPGWPVLLAAAISVASKEWIYRYTLQVGKRIGSDLLIANAWHSRSDAFSSIIVFIGALGAIAGLTWLDTVAAVLVAGIIARIGWNLAWENVKQLVDTAMPAETTDRILQLARETEGVRDVHAIRTRKMGREFLLDMHLQVDPAISVSEGHQIGVRVTERIRAVFEDIRDLTFHIDPENDGVMLDPQSGQLPTRSEVIEALKVCWKPLLDFDHIGPIRLHYLGQRVSVELFLNHEDAVRSGQLGEAALSQEIASRAADLSWIGTVRVWRARRVL